MTLATKSNIIVGKFYKWEYRSALIILIMVALACTSFLFNANKYQTIDRVDRYYMDHLSSLDEKVAVLEHAAGRDERLELFRESRLIYKKIEFLIEYYNVFHARNLNGANLLKAEDDNPKDTIFPHGFQVLESLIYSNAQQFEVAAEIKSIRSTISELTKEHDRKLKYSNAGIFDALRLEVFRIITLGISGFDSPLAQHSIAEAEAALSSISDVIELYSPHLRNNEKADLLLKMLSRASDYLLENGNFNKFDRLRFIKQYADPITREIVSIARENEFAVAADRRPLKPSAASLFEIEAFDLNFFSPNENYRVTKERTALGRKLFYDPILSSSGKRSCSSCHKPELAFTDGLKLSKDVNDELELDRNTPTLINSVFQTKQFYDMRTSKLENQLSDVVHNKKEMGGSLKDIIPVLTSHTTYSKEFRLAYALDKNPITEYTIANAISSYVRSLVDFDSKFDRYMRNEGAKLTKKEVNGFNLFMGKAKCGTCHFMPLFNGLVPPVFSETEAEVLAVPQTASKKNPKLDPDLGRGGFTGIPLHNHAFKTPTLRNIARTAPYMHNGVYNTLEEVLNFYNQGGGTALGIAPLNQTLPPDSLNLSRNELRDLKAFLLTLTGSGVDN